MNDPIPFSFKCDARWDDMLGSGGKRLCTQCNTPVVDLSSLSKEEADEVLATPGVCVNYIVQNGEVVYGRKKGEPDPAAPAHRDRARSRGRRRRLLRWASAAASVAAAGALPGVAAAGPAASDESGAFERIRGWVASWFEDESCSGPEERLGGEPVPVDTGTEATPPPPIRLGGAPMRIERPERPMAGVVATIDGPVQMLEARCSDQRSKGLFTDHTARLAIDPGPGQCTVIVRYHDMKRLQTDVTLVDGATVTCRVFDEALICD